jgi:hypothetical protein
MLHNVPQAISRMARNVVLNHPNTYNCEVYRKVTLRQGEATVAGNPTLGGLTVLNSADEEDYEYRHLGDGYALPAEAFGPAPLMDRRDADTGSGEEFRFIIEPEGQAGSSEWFEPRITDVVYLLLGDGPNPARLAFEVVGLETTTHIAPYTARYITNRRDDLHLPAGAAPDGPEGSP